MHNLKETAICFLSGWVIAFQVGNVVDSLNGSDVRVSNLIGSISKSSENCIRPLKFGQELGIDLVWGGRGEFGFHPDFLTQLKGDEGSLLELLVTP